VNEISLSKNQTIYLVQVQDEKNLKVLRVTDDEIKILQEFEK
jgi:flagellar biogenesis protein FliO